MIKEKLDFYRSILLERRKFILETIERIRSTSQVQEEENYIKYADNLADRGSDTMEKEEYYLILSRELKYLNRINDTLELINRGEYGICKICNKEIAHERLEAVPTTDTCVNCKNIQVKRFSKN